VSDDPDSASVTLKGDPMADGHVIRDPLAIADALKHACERTEVVILSTPYMTCETSFVRMDGETFHVSSASMELDDVRYGLKSPELMFRFPHGHRFYAGATRLVGMGVWNGRHTIRLALPDSLADDERRAAYRVERPGGSVTFSTRKNDLLVGALTDISTSGARIYSSKEISDEDVLAGDGLHLTIVVGADIRFNAKAIVRHIQDRRIGLEFRPELHGETLDNLSRWAFRKRENAISRTIGVDGVGADGNKVVAQATDLDTPCVVLITSCDEVEAKVRNLMPADGPLAFRRISPNGQSMREIKDLRKAMIAFHVTTGDMNERRKLKIMIDIIPKRFPYILLCDSQGVNGLQAMGTDLAADGTCVIGPFMPRLFKLVHGKRFGEPEAAKPQE
jgi:hypothetical protein